MSTISPLIPYRHPRAAIDFLCDALGFERQAVHASADGQLQHVVLRLGDDVTMPTDIEHRPVGGAGLRRRADPTPP